MIVWFLVFVYDLVALKPLASSKTVNHNQSTWQNEPPYTVSQGAERSKVY